MSYDLTKLAYDVAKREALAVDKWMASLGVTVATIDDYVLEVSHPRGGGTEYRLYRRHRRNDQLIGKLSVSYTAIDCEITTDVPQYN